MEEVEELKLVEDVVVGVELGLVVEEVEKLELIEELVVDELGVVV